MTYVLKRERLYYAATTAQHTVRSVTHPDRAAHLDLTTADMIARHLKQLGLGDWTPTPITPWREDQ